MGSLYIYKVFIIHNMCLLYNFRIISDNNSTCIKSDYTHEIVYMYEFQPTHNWPIFH